jgi:ELWxxDGT repeat protein
MRKMRFDAAVAVAPTPHGGRSACTLEQLERRLVLAAAAYAVASPVPMDGFYSPPLQGANGELYVSTSSGLFRTVGDGGSCAAKVSDAPATAMFDWKGALYFQTKHDSPGGLDDTLMKLEPGSAAPVELKAGGQNRVATTKVFVPTPDKLFLGAAAGVYVTDGTPQGTTFLHTGTPVGALGGKMFFRDQASSSSPASLWVTDGTLAGTTLVQDNRLAFNGVAFHGAFYFGSDDGLYRTDGTAAGTTRVTTARAGWSPTPVGDALYFIEPTNGITLYKTDGTDAGTVVVGQNLETPGYEGYLYFPSPIAVIGDTVYFTARDAANAVQVFATSGPGTTRQVTTINNAGGYIGVEPGLAQVDGQLFFTTFTASGPGLWTGSGAPRVYHQVAGAGSTPRAPLQTPVGRSRYY